MTLARFSIALSGGPWHSARVARPKASAPKFTLAQRESSRAALSPHMLVLEPHLQRLSQLPAHGNRLLHHHQLVLGLLLSFLDPLARSLRRIEDAKDFGGRLDLSRLARSTTSDALALFDPAVLLPVIQDLQARVPDLVHDDPDLAQITRRIIAADGTYLNTFADVTLALRQRGPDGKTRGRVRANVQLDTATWVPQVVSVSGKDGQSEAMAAAKDLLEGVLYVVDRNFLEFAFLERLLAKHNDFVLRVRCSAPAVRALQSRDLSPEDRQAGVVADELVELTGKDATPGVFRLVTIHAADRDGAPQVIRLLTNLTDESIPARVIGAIYRRRWQIELFFKWLKCWARMGHLLSTSQSGITTQLYVTVIAVLLMHVQTGRRVSVYTLTALSRLAFGQLTLEEAMEVIGRRERERELNRARQARKRALQKQA